MVISGERGAYCFVCALCAVSAVRLGRLYC